MTENKTKESSQFSAVKTFFIENLWVVVLLAPFLMMLVLGVKKLQPEPQEYSQSGVKKSSSYISGARTLVTSIGVEITSTELAKIIARPISKLLLMRVYFDSKKSARVTAYEFENFSRNGVINQVLASQRAYENASDSLFVNNIEHRKVADRY